MGKGPIGEEGLVQRVDLQADLFLRVADLGLGQRRDGLVDLDAAVFAAYQALPWRRVRDFGTAPARKVDATQKLREGRLLRKGDPVVVLVGRRSWDGKAGYTNAAQGPLGLLRRNHLLKKAIQWLQPRESQKVVQARDGQGPEVVPSHKPSPGVEIRLMLRRDRRGCLHDHYSALADQPSCVQQSSHWIEHVVQDTGEHDDVKQRSAFQATWKLGQRKTAEVLKIHVEFFLKEPDSLTKVQPIVGDQMSSTATEEQYGDQTLHCSDVDTVQSFHAQVPKCAAREVDVRVVRAVCESFGLNLDTVVPLALQNWDADSRRVVH